MRHKYDRGFVLFCSRSLLKEPGIGNVERLWVIFAIKGIGQFEAAGAAGGLFEFNRIVMGADFSEGLELIDLIPIVEMISTVVSKMAGDKDKK
ncbi:MAG TPA: hypothetical protein GX391_01240 [Firmicutes bacterium]|jgi:hypothetical protein|nr:hypothetical protein [Bacillota bacterium]HOQ25056.1 hypothetical protein [Bacillota bacterium]HPT68343.1 hypothetical protein [Bacillota bacterium]